jgi:hypothetical protein
MRLGGLLLMLMGTAALGSYLYLPSPQDDAADLAEVTRISIAPYHPARSDDTVRTFSPTSPAFHDVVRAESNVSPPDRAPPTVWTTVVTPDRSKTTVLHASRPGDSATRYELARDIQRELKRAACYGGEITGVWSPATKRAMAVFLERANATLPIKNPDYILLSLVQNHTEVTCADECPSGQTMTQSGRCVRNTPVVQASKQSKPINESGRADARNAGTQARVAAAPERLPWLDSNGRSLVTQPEPRATPPPGMMSIGGPSALVPTSPNNGASTGTALQDAPGPFAAPNTSNVASLASEVDAGVPPMASPNSLAVAKPHRRAKRSRDWGERPRHYGHYGRTRRGEPRPGTMRYNLVQALGGIY